jgi:hypothetical protein
MNSFLVVTPYKRFSMDGSAVSEVFKQWRFHVLCEEPYTVIIVAPLALAGFTADIGRFPFEYEVTELGKTETVKGIGLK